MVITALAEQLSVPNLALRNWKLDCKPCLQQVHAKAGTRVVAQWRLDERIRLHNWMRPCDCTKVQRNDQPAILRFMIMDAIHRMTIRYDTVLYNAIGYDTLRHCVVR